MQPSIDVSVVVPCFNEEANLDILVSRLFAAAERAHMTCEVVAVDDGSTDSTWKVIGALGEEHPDAVRGVQHEVNSGIPVAWRTGIEAARGTYVCLIDADLQNPPEQVVTLYERLLESRADICQGVRSQIERERDGRLAFSKGLNAVLNIAFGDRAADSKSGFVLGPRRVMADIVDYHGDYRVFQAFIRVAARAKGYTIVEVETLFLPRNAGESFLAGSRAWKVSAATFADFPRALKEFGRSRREPIDGTVAPRSRPVPKAEHSYTGWRWALFEAYFATAPIHHRLTRRRVRSIYLELKQTEWLPREELADLQSRKLQRLIQHASVHVPYYRETFAEVGVGAEAVSTVKDLASLPILERQQLRERLYFDLFSDTHRKKDMAKIATSGSTGEPLVTYVDRYQLEARLATAIRAAEWSGWRFGDRQVRIGDSQVGSTALDSARFKIDAWLMRRLDVPAIELEDGGAQGHVEEIEKWRPVLIDGYAQSLKNLGVRVDNPSGNLASAAILRASEWTSSDGETVEDLIDGAVVDAYGCAELGDVAYQCEFGLDHHVMDESFVVEIVVDGRAAAPGELGDVVITDLNNFSVPLIRYRIGDQAIAVDNGEPCPCGRGLSRIGRIQAPTHAPVLDEHGRAIAGDFFAHFFGDYGYLVKAFQVRHVHDGSLVVALVPGSQWTEAGQSQMLRELREYVGRSNVIVERVESIPW